MITYNCSRAHRVDEFELFISQKQQFGAGYKLGKSRSGLAVNPCTPVLEDVVATPEESCGAVLEVEALIRTALEDINKNKFLRIYMDTFVS